MTRVSVAVIAASIILTNAIAEAQIPAEVLQAEEDRIAAIQRATRSAVAVLSPDGGGGGSAVVVSRDGFALTNYHVTSPVGPVMKCGMADGGLYDAVIVGVDPTGDVALIKLFGRDDFTPARIADSDLVRVGDWCFAVGNPFLLATDFQPTVTYGIVSGVHRYQHPSGSILEYADCLQTDAAINPGNSGGPLFNAEGELIGINGRASFEKRGRVNVGLGYAISMNQILKFMGHLHSGRVVDHATLGATVTDDSSNHVVVSNILESSDAHRRGLRYGDELVFFGDRSIATANEFKNALGIYPRGWRVRLGYLRDGQRFDTYVRLGGVHAGEELADLVAPRQRPPAQEPKKQPEKPAPPPAGRSELHSPAIPQHLAAFLEIRRGFANYYFNRENRTRVWQGFVQQSEFGKRTGTWRLSGATKTEPKIQLELGDTDSLGDFGFDVIPVSEDPGLSQQLGPRGSGGLVVALHLWRRLLVRGPEQFGEVYYLGKVPLPNRDGLYDVLVATYDVLETHFMFDPVSGQLAALEMYPDADVDPCEIYFDDYRDAGGCQIPHAMRVRRGDTDYTEITIYQVEYPVAEESET